jgi:ABC-type phosphate transport system substrate-binding protein
MKTLKSIFAIILVFLGVCPVVNASDGSEEVIYIKSEKFFSPLVEKWIAEYGKLNPKVQIKWVDKDSKETDLYFVTNAEAETDGSYPVAYVGRYALLPVISKENPLYEQIEKKKFGKKELKNLFFIEDFLVDEADNNKKDLFQNRLTVYSGNGSHSGAAIFASYFGYSTSHLRGKRISGDDIYLITAIKKDNTGLIFNNLSYIYDLNDRRLKAEIALLPLDVKKDQFETFRSENLDETLALLEEQKVELVPIEKIGFVYKDKDSTKDFLKWVITEGQKFNHAYGFLSLDEKTLAGQKKNIEATLLSNN